MVKNVSPSEVDKAKQETRLLFVDCWAAWCGPCLALAPILEGLEQKYSDNPDVGFLKVDTQEYRQFATDNSIHAIPCVLVFFDGEPFRGGQGKKSDRLIGLRPPEHYEEVIKQLLK
jgi:thioredoxin 1